jgi:hypothetical protein
MNLKNGIDRDSVVTPFEGVLGETGETVCTSVAFWKLGALQETKVERFPKLDVAGSIPVSRSKLFIDLAPTDFKACSKMLQNPLGGVANPSLVHWKGIL